MATGGNVAYSTTVEPVMVFGRVSSAGAKVAPASGAGKWTVASGSTGVYSITFTEAYSEFLGAVIQLEAASGVAQVVSFTAATRVLLINIFNVDGTTAANKAFSFVATFTENKVP